MSAYLVCSSCEEGRADLENDPRVDEFASAHASHGALTVVPEFDFLSDYVERGFIDVDAPDRKPLPRRIGMATGTLAGKAAPFGTPGDVNRTARMHRLMRVKAKSASESDETVATDGGVPITPPPTPGVHDLSFIKPGIAFTYRKASTPGMVQIDFEGYPSIIVAFPLANAMLRELLV